MNIKHKVITETSAVLGYNGQTVSNERFSKIEKILIKNYREGIYYLCSVPLSPALDWKQYFKSTDFAWFVTTETFWSIYENGRSNFYNVCLVDLAPNGKWSILFPRIQSLQLQMPEKTLFVVKSGGCLDERWVVFFRIHSDQAACQMVGAYDFNHKIQRLKFGWDFVPKEYSQTAQCEILS